MVKFFCTNAGLLSSSCPKLSVNMHINLIALLFLGFYSVQRQRSKHDTFSTLLALHPEVMLTITFFACNPRHRLTNALSCGMKVLLNDWNQFAENLSASLMNIVQGLSYLGFPLIKIIFVGMRFPLLLGPLERNTTVSTFSLLNSCCELHGD